jgi:hypothetical protein
MKFIAVDNLEGKTYMKEFLRKARNARNLSSFKIRMIHVLTSTSIVVYVGDEISRSAIIGTVHPKVN